LLNSTTSGAKGETHEGLSQDEEREEQFVIERQMEKFHAAAEQFQCEWHEDRFVALVEMMFAARPHANARPF
jgi:hypothetical protein